MLRSECTVETVRFAVAHLDVLDMSHRIRLDKCYASGLAMCARYRSQPRPNYYLLSQYKSPAALVEAAGLVLLQAVPQLEREPRTNLPVAWQLLRLGLPKRAAQISQVAVEVGEIHAVEDIEELKPYLEMNSLRDGCVLVDVQVALLKIRRTELHGFLVAFCAKRGRGELPGSEHSVEESAFRGSLLVAGHIRVIETSGDDAGHGVGAFAVNVVIAASRTELIGNCIAGGRAARGVIAGVGAIGT